MSNQPADARARENASSGTEGDGMTAIDAGAAAPRQVQPLNPPMVPFAIGGMVAWAVAGLVLLPMRERLSDAGHGSWLWICLAGLLVGIPGLITMIRHDARRRH